MSIRSNSFAFWGKSPKSHLEKRGLAHGRGIISASLAWYLRMQPGHCRLKSVVSLVNRAVVAGRPIYRRGLVLRSSEYMDQCVGVGSRNIFE